MIRTIRLVAVLSLFVSYSSLACGGCSGKKANFGSGGVAAAPGSTVSTTAGPGNGATTTASNGNSGSFSKNFFNETKSEPGQGSTDENYSTAISQ